MTNSPASLDASFIELIDAPTPVQEMIGLRRALGGGPRLLVKRDDTIPFGFGGNKIRKLQYEVAKAMSSGADTLVTLGGVQSNHARATAAVAAKLGLKCVLVINGSPRDRPTANALLDRMLGAEIEYIPSRNERAEASTRVVERLRSHGRKPYLIPLGASTSLGAMGFASAVREMVDQKVIPDVIVHATSSGGTQAGLIAGITSFGLKTRVLGVSADDPAESLRDTVRSIVRGIKGLESFNGQIDVDDTRVGAGYGAPTDASREAQELAARREGFFVDHTYTAKALGALISWVRDGWLTPDQTVLFWHTGGQVGLFA